MASYTANDTIDGYKIELELDGAGQYFWTINNPDGSELFRAGGGMNGRTSSVLAGFSNLANKAAASGNDELANTYRNVSSAFSSVGPQLVANVNDQYKNANPPPPAEPVPPAAEETPNTNNLGNTPASDDASYDKAEAARLSNYSSPGVVDGNNSTPTINAAGAGSTQAGSATVSSTSNTGSNTSVAGGTKPGKRTFNPLGNFSSYTYQLSLYMITPDAYNAFVQTGRKNINALMNSGGGSKGAKGGAFLIAQSGGINNQSTKRAPGFDLDYYIDDLKMQSKVAGAATQTASNVTSFSFNIYEPYGFSFLTKLKNAQEQLASYSSLPNTKDQINPTKSIFVLGVRFQGYDKDGNIADASSVFSQDTLNTSSDRSGVYERFYDIVIETFKFKLSGNATVYNVTARPITIAAGMSVARGMVDVQAPLTAGTVKEALIGNGNGVVSLFGTLNKRQQTLKSEGTIDIPLVYDVKFIGDTELSIGSAVLVSDADKDKRKLPMSKAASLSQVNDSTSTSATPDTTKRLITITNDTPIPQAINKIIQQSSYLEDALKIMQDSEIDPPSPAEGNGEVVQKDPAPFNWYNLSVELECLGFDKKVGDWAYKMTYVIQPYASPMIVSPYVNTPKYYGPHKRYEYWYTGENREILGYEHTVENGYFNVTMNPSGDPNSQAGGFQTSTVPGKRTSEDRQGRTGEGLETHNSVITSLFDPGSWAKAKITILGDPDYLVRDGADSVNGVYSQFYGTDGYTINPNGGQVFIEIMFKEGIDYDTSQGTMNINSQIYMWNYPPNVTNPPKGVVYQLVEIDHHFKGGKFTQSIDAKIAPFPSITDNTSDAGRPTQNTTTPSDVRTGSTGTSPTPDSGSQTSASTGLLPDQNQSAAEITRLTNANSAAIEAQSNESVAETARLNRLGTQTTQVAPTNNPATPQTANDDSVSNAGMTQAGSATVSSADAGRETPANATNDRTGTGE